MAYVVRRPRGRWEIRESIATDEGPRARTLASFTKLTPFVLERAATVARTPFDSGAVIRSARRAGARFERSAADSLAVDLLRRVASGQSIRPGLRRVLVDCLMADPGQGDRPGVDQSMIDWIGATDAERGAALVDLLGLADSLPKKRRGALDFPGLSRERLHAR